MIYRTTEEIIQAAYLTIKDRIQIKGRKLDKHIKRVKNRTKLNKKK